MVQTKLSWPEYELQEEGRKRKSSGAIYSFSMGHVEEKITSYVTDPAGKCGASQGTRNVSHQLPTVRSFVFGNRAKSPLGSGVAVSFSQMLCRS